MRGLIRRAAIVAGAAVVVAGSAVGVAAASPGPPVLAFSPSPYDYRQVTVGQTAAQTFTLKNSGGKASGALTVTVAGSAAFTITADACTAASVGPGKSCTVSVRFAPASTGTVAATLTAASKNGAAMATAALTGTGTPASHLYWTNFASEGAGAGTVNEANLDGTNPQAIVTGQTGPAGVAVDSSHIYWANEIGPNGDPNSGLIKEAPLTGGTATTLVPGQNSPAGVAVGPQ